MHPKDRRLDKLLMYEVHRRAKEFGIIEIMNAAFHRLLAHAIDGDEYLRLVVCTNDPGGYRLDSWKVDKIGVLDTETKPERIVRFPVRLLPPDVHWAVAKGRPLHEDLRKYRGPPPAKKVATPEEISALYDDLVRAGGIDPRPKAKSKPRPVQYGRTLVPA